MPQIGKRNNEGERVVVRFKNATGLRYTGVEFASVTMADVSSLNEFLAKHSNIVVKPLFAQTPAALDREIASLATQTGERVPLLSGYYSITAKDRKQAQAICTDLRSIPFVDEVYIEPPAFPAIVVEPAEVSSIEVLPTTPDLSFSQGYLNAASEGIDARFAWTVDGGKGEKVQIIDIEGDWNFNHEDLLQNQGGLIDGTPPTDTVAWQNHGTAVQGVIAADENQIGVLGIAPAAKFSAVSIFGPDNSTARAIKMAADKLNQGDILIIELHRPGPKATDSGQFGFIPLEWWSADFDAIKYATAKGIIVIAASGNGSQDLDDPVYEGKFDRSKRDSGAILIGAGAPPSGTNGPDCSRLSFSNYGAIVDAQGWGLEVTTTGYGDLQGGPDKNRWYTKMFNGTSSATPIVVGAMACLQSIHMTQRGNPLTYTQLREVLHNTGSPQTDAPGLPKEQRIGNRVDIKAALVYSGLVQQQVSQIATGIATRYWDECLPHPPGNMPGLSLYVKNSWKRLDSPTQGIRDVVQRAFLGSGSQVRVWYAGSTIVGLVVEGTTKPIVVRRA